MVDDAEDGVEATFKCVVCVTERSGNLRKGLKKGTIEALSNLIHYFVQVERHLESKRVTNNAQELKFKLCKEEIQRLINWTSTRTEQLAPSMDTERRETVTACQAPSSAGRGRSVRHKEKNLRANDHIQNQPPGNSI